MQSNLTTLKDKLDATRQKLRDTQRGIQINEGRLLDFETADNLQRSLYQSIKQLEEIGLTVAVLERKAVQHG